VITYNLTFRQKELLHQLVTNSRNGQLTSDFLTICYPNPSKYNSFICQISLQNGESVEFDQIDDLLALCENVPPLMTYRWNSRHTDRLFNIRQAGFDAVDNNFGSVSPEIDSRKLKDMHGKTRILFLAANPTDTTRLRLDEEVRAIDQALQQAKFRDAFNIQTHWAVRVRDLQPLLLRHEPTIVHFSGHGSHLSEIFLEDDYGAGVTVPTNALSKLFALFKDSIKCVILSACFSEPQAQSIAEQVGFVIGMSAKITDKAAIRFASSFYQALGFGKDVQTAFQLGCLEIDLHSLGEENVPKLVIKQPIVKPNPSYILVVDDDDSIRQRIGSILRANDYEVVEAKTNAQALDILANSRINFSLVITDALRRLERYGEQGYVGLDLIRIINVRFRELPVILVSRDSPDFLMKHAPDLQVRALLGKNLSDRELMANIYEVLNGKILANPWWTPDRR